METGRLGRTRGLTMKNLWRKESSINNPFPDACGAGGNVIGADLIDGIHYPRIRPELEEAIIEIRDWIRKHPIDSPSQRSPGTASQDGRP